MTAAGAARASTDAAAALDAAERFLLGMPVHNSLVLSLLLDRVAIPQSGRYWWVEGDDEVVGFLFQSPLHFQAVVSPASPEVLDVLVERVAAEAPGVPGIMAEAATAAAFAGRWAETLAVPVVPVEAQRIYRLSRLRPPPPVPGHLRQAAPDDRTLLVGWMAGFLDETGLHPFPPEELFDRHIGRGGLWVWETDRPVSMAVSSRPAAGMSRIGFVYTPPEDRGLGYAAAAVAALSGRVVSEGLGCILNTQLQNPTSNALYRRIGFEPVVETLIYRFG